MSAPWDELARVGESRDAARLRVVPFVGTGFNAQAGKRVSWRELLVGVAKESGVDVRIPPANELVGNMTLVWEAMLIELARQTRKAPHAVESTLRHRVAAALRDAYAPGGITRDFAARFLALGFRDVVSFNFDLGMHLDRRAAWGGPPSSFDVIAGHATLPCGTRVWYPHGSVRKPSTIQLGMRTYGTLIKGLEEARSRSKAIEERLFAGVSRRLSVHGLRQRWDEHRDLSTSWVGATMNAPIVCVGLGMGREEWPLWWFLNQRVRNHARRGHHVPTFVLLHATEARRLRTAARLARLTLLPFDDYGAGWERLFRCLGHSASPD